MTEEEKIDLLIRGWIRGIPMERIYKLAILRRCFSGGTSLEGRFPASDKVFHRNTVNHE